MATLFVQSNTLYLAGSGVIIGATSITLTSITDIYGNVLTMADFGALGYITLEPDTTNEEGATFTGITANANGTYTLTGVKTILAKSPYTQTSGLIRNHSGGTKVVITDNVAFWDTFLNKNNNSTIAGKYTFDDTTNRPQLSADTDTAVNAELVTFGQLSRQAIAGAANASTTVKGLVELATQAEMDAKTTTGATGALLVPTPDVIRSTLLSDYKADTGAADAYIITPIPAAAAYTAGQVFSFKATNVNTTTSTLNVSGLGVKTIKKAGGATNLVAGDIAAGMIVIVEYDGTNFVMLNPVANTVSLTAGAYPAGDGSALTGVGTKIVNVFTNVTTSSNVTETTLVTGTIPANTLGTTGAIRVRLYFSSVSNTSTGTSWTLRLKYGGSTVVSYAPQVAWTTIPAFVEMILMASGATGTQEGTLYSQISSTLNVSTGTSAVDSTASQTLLVTSQFSNSSASDAMTMVSATVERII